MLMLALSPAEVGSATQTDWSGGGGVSGPVTDWGNTFDFEIDIYWSGSSDDLLLDGLAPGVYMVRMSSGDFTDTQRFVLIE